MGETLKAGAETFPCRFRKRFVQLRIGLNVATIPYGPVAVRRVYSETTGTKRDPPFLAC